MKKTNTWIPLSVVISMRSSVSLESQLCLSLWWPSWLTSWDGSWSCRNTTSGRSCSRLWNMGKECCVTAWLPSSSTWMERWRSGRLDSMIHPAGSWEWTIFSAVACHAKRKQGSWGMQIRPTQIRWRRPCAKPVDGAVKVILGQDRECRLDISTSWQPQDFLALIPNDQCAAVFVYAHTINKELRNQILSPVLSTERNPIMFAKTMRLSTVSLIKFWHKI